MDDIEFSYLERKILLMTIILMKNWKFELYVSEGKVRGKDLNWTKKCNFDNPKTLEDSNILDELKDNYLIKRRWPLSIIMLVNILREKNFCHGDKKSELCFLPTDRRFLCKNVINMNILKTLTLLTKA